MPATTRPGSFQHSRNAHGTAGLEKCPSVLAPAFLIEIDGQEKTRLVLKHWINACDKRLTRLIKTRQVPTNHFIGHWKKTLVLAVRALDSRLLADASNPFIAAGRRVTRSPGFPALEPPRINVVSTTEERAEKFDLNVSQ